MHPEDHPDEIAKVLARGETPAGSHRPIMVEEVLEALDPRPGQTVMDCTLGYGGHARELYAAVQPGGRLLAVDVDPFELPRTQSRLKELGYPEPSLLVRRMNFSGVPDWIAEITDSGVDILFADLGLSSMQLDDPARGFSYKFQGPLDMRMSPEQGPSAATWLAHATTAELTNILEENADLSGVEDLSQAILQAHDRDPKQSTRDLAGVIRHEVMRRPQEFDDTPDGIVRRVFQALRIAVNGEFDALDHLLEGLPSCMKSGGRVAFLTFHSGEDRRVKKAFKAGLNRGDFSEVARRVIRPSPEEQRANSRSGAAKLRVAIRA